MSAATIARPSRTLPASAVRLLIAARSALTEAADASDSGERYAAAHLAALRTAAVVLADRTRPADPRIRRPTSAWKLLTGVAPELGEWAAYFAAGASKRAAAEAGIRSAVTAREADDLVRDATIFLQLIETTLGVLPGTVSRAG
jgi:SAV_6107-like HEPN